MKRFPSEFIFYILILLLCSCGKKKSFDIIDFDPYSNFKSSSDTLSLEMDLSDAILNGVSIPSDTAKNKYFLISFRIKNNTGSPDKFYYNVYYQNESYKFKEYIPDLLQNKNYNPKASQNFYGSWDGTRSGFHETEIIPCDNQYHLIIDSIRITGNPRNEKKYFGGKRTNSIISEKEIKETILKIQQSISWMAQIKEKAKTNNTSISKQLYMDAKWYIEWENNKGEINNRWKRNPRTGLYSFLLIVAKEEDKCKIPVYVSNISIQDSVNNKFYDPYYYFLYKNKRNEYSSVILSHKYLKTKVKIDFTKGIYIDPSHINDSTKGLDTNSYCGFSDKLFKYANIEQFFHNMSNLYKLKNIPLVYDVVGDNYSQKLYEENSKKFNDNELINDKIKITDFPGRTIIYDSSRNAICIRNPGNNKSHYLRKENVGIRVRHGFTYGKFRAKIMFPKMLSNENVWNGLTCAFWLIYQDGDWNKREICNSGFETNNNGSNQVTKEQQAEYSEIDIEIIKTSKYWPKSSYGISESYPVDNGLNNNVILACTNWDLACHDPINFIVGAKRINYNGRIYYIHRWDDWYKAVTSKYENPQSETVGCIMYYEIDWEPEEIIWKIGSDKENMKIIGHMDATNTKIPDNQMEAVITQEFHYASFWPPAPFLQDNIPYPKNDLVGYIYEIEIE